MMTAMDFLSRFQVEEIFHPLCQAIDRRCAQKGQDARCRDTIDSSFLPSFGLAPSSTLRNITLNAW
jgi:hypothetical protein